MSPKVYYNWIDCASAVVSGEFLYLAGPSVCLIQHAPQVVSLGQGVASGMAKQGVTLKNLVGRVRAQPHKRIDVAVYTNKMF